MTIQPRGVEPSETTLHHALASHGSAESFVADAVDSLVESLERTLGGCWDNDQRDDVSDGLEGVRLELTAALTQIALPS